MTSAANPPADAYAVRRFMPTDATGITALVQRIYRSHYSYRDELYHPDEIVRLNQSGRLISVVAFDPAGTLVGHCAIMRNDLGPVAETGESMVDPAHRSHHLMHRMRALLYEEAPRVGITALHGSPVANHPFSQKVYEAFGSHPCGVFLGLLPRTFENLSHPLPQRLSDVSYFKFLTPPAPTVGHAPEHHRPIIERIYAQFAVPVEYRPPGPLTEEGHVVTSYLSALEHGLIQVRRAGTKVPDEIVRSRQALCQELQAGAIFLELPLDQPGTPELCRRAEEDGFFFSGIGPLAGPTGDVLRLQYLNEPLDTALVQIENPFAQEMLEYIVKERERVRK
jgi:serine/threonine-protein kinase RsbW